MTLLARRFTDSTPIIPNAIDADGSPATRPATRRQRRVAGYAAVFLTLITLLLFPFATQQLPKFQAFFPIYQTAVTGTYLITAYLMFSQYRATQSQSLLYLSAGMLYTAGVLIVQMMAAPGAFVEKGQLIGGTQSLTYLWFFWHLGPIVSTMVYAWTEYRQPGAKSLDRAGAVGRVGSITLLLFVASVVLVTGFKEALPVMDVNGNYSGITTSGTAPAMEVMLLVALGMLWRVGRFRNVLHIWLGLALVALLCDNAITMMGASRLSLGWYMGRVNALISSAVMMCIYLQEIKFSYLHATDDVTRLSLANAGLAVRVDEARRDILTKLPSRELFMERAEALRLASIASHTGFATLFIDLDGFKSINDTFGHEHGDVILIRVAEAIRSVLREADVPGRLGGDEFVACLAAPANMSLVIASKIAERVVDKIGKLGDGIGASVGISISAASVEIALHEADEAMYACKKQGKNRFSLYRAKPKLAYSV